MKNLAPTLLRTEMPSPLYGSPACSRPGRTGVRFALVLAVGILLGVGMGIPGLGRPEVARADDQTPIELLKKTEEQEQQPRFRGKKVSVDFTHPFPKVSNWEITHFGVRQERMERISPRGKQEEIVVIRGREKLHYITKQGLLVREIIQGDALTFDPKKKNIDLARKNYTIKTMGESKVDTRKVVRIHLQPRFAGRPRQEIWIDPEVGLSLRSELYRESGNLSSMETFSEVEINPALSDTVLQLKLPRQVRRAEVVVYPQPDMESALKNFDWPVYVPGFLPEGFALRGIVLNRIGNLSRLQLMYSDGISALSVFEEQYRPAPGSSIGPKFFPEDGYLTVSHGLTNLLAFLRGEMKLVVVGEIEKEEINRIAESMKPTTATGGTPQ